MKFLLGTKQEMTQIFDETGQVVPATVVSAGPSVITQIRTTERDGYTAVQVGFGKKSKQKVSKALFGHLKNLGPFGTIREFRLKEPASEVNVGDTLSADIFAEGDVVTVSGVSKGKGFAGVVKRHGFHGGPRTHGQKHSEREPGSIGGGLRTRVPKGMRMAGRMGGERITVRNLKVLRVDKENNRLVISGAVPGRRGTVLEIRGANLK